MCGCRSLWCYQGRGRRLFCGPRQARRHRAPCVYERHLGQRLRRQQFRAVAIAYFVCSDQLFISGPDVGTHKTTDGAPDAGAQYIDRTDGHALHPAVVTTFTGAHINTDDAAVFSTYQSSIT